MNLDDSQFQDVYLSLFRTTKLALIRHMTALLTTVEIANCRIRCSIRAGQLNAAEIDDLWLRWSSRFCVLCTVSKMKSVRIFVFVVGLLCYVRSGKLYESSTCNQKMPTVFAF
jgi:hypothetical protein